VASVLAACVWVAGLLWLWWRAEPLVLRALTHWERQGQAATARATPPVLPSPEAMPLDLRLWIAEQSEPWAKEQLAQRAQELYGQYGDWSAVRVALTAA